MTDGLLDALRDRLAREAARARLFQSSGAAPWLVLETLPSVHPLLYRARGGGQQMTLVCRVAIGNPIGCRFPEFSDTVHRGASRDAIIFSGAILYEEYPHDAGPSLSLALVLRSDQALR